MTVTQKLLKLVEMITLAPSQWIDGDIAKIQSCWRLVEVLYSCQPAIAGSDKDTDHEYRFLIPLLTSPTQAPVLEITLEYISGA